MEACKATAKTLKERNLNEFWGNIETAANALQPRQCDRVGTFKNPIKLSGDKVAVVVKWLIIAVQTFGAGKIDPGIDNPNAPDPVSQSIYQVDIKANVPPGSWFYFSSEPDWIMEWSGEYISTVYDKKNGVTYFYDREGNLSPST